MSKIFTEDDVLAEIRQAIAETSLRQVAARIGVSAPFLSDVMKGNRGVSETVASSFGFDREIVTTVSFRKRAA